MMLSRADEDQILRLELIFSILYNMRGITFDEVYQLVQIVRVRRVGVFFYSVACVMTLAKMLDLINIGIFHILSPIFYDFTVIIPLLFIKCNIIV